MPLPSSGPISLSQVNVELGLSATAPISMNDAAVRTLFQKTGSGTTISMSDGYGKANQFTFTISSNQTNANLRSLAVAAGWNQSSAVVATVASNVYVYSTSTGNAGLTIDGSWPGGVTLVNNGFILGKGGDAPTSDQFQYSKPGNAGGSAISLGVSCTITNNSYIAGGGGSGAASLQNGSLGGAGGGAGGGNGGSSAYGGGTLSGGAGGGPGSAGGNGGRQQYATDKYGGPIYYFSGAGGGRILPGSGGAGGGPFGAQNAATGGGAGGGGISDGTTTNSGGSAGNPGTGTTNPNFIGSGGGGGWGAVGGYGRFGNYTGGSSGGAGGRAIQLNGYTATRNGGGTTYGAVS